MYWLIFLGVLIAILWLVKWGIIAYAIVSSLFCGGHKDNYSGGGCPFGYDSFGCQPHCPLYEHCWGKRDD